MCKFIPDLPCLFSFTCLIPPRAEGSMSKHFYLLQERVLEVQSQDIRCGTDLHNNVKILCGCYKDTLHHQTDQGANPVCAGCRPQDPGLLAEALISSLLYKTGLTCAPQDCCELSEDVYEIHLPQDLAWDEGSKYDSQRPSSPTLSDRETWSQQHQWVTGKQKPILKAFSVLFSGWNRVFLFSKQVRRPSYNHFIFPVSIISGGRKSNS